MDVKKISDGGLPGLDPDFFDRIRDAAEKAAQREGERPSFLPPAHGLVMGFMLGRQEAETQRGETNKEGHVQIRTTQLPRAYPPCIKSAHELEHIMISEMLLETHHRGRKLLLRVLTPPHRINGVTAVVEDLRGTAITLQLYHLPDESVVPAEEFVSMGRFCLLKEPFFKASVHGSYILRVDHVNDIQWLDNNDEHVPVPLRINRMLTMQETSLELRTKGNDAIQRKEWAKAARLYSSAAKVAQTKEEAQMARLNRSLANLNLGRLEEALSDACGQEGRFLEKGLFREARALFALARYEESLEKMLTLTKGDSMGYMGAKAQLINQLAQKLQNNPESSRSFLDLYHGDYPAVSVHEVDGRPVVDTFLITNIITSNCFGAPRISLQAVTGGIGKEFIASGFSTCGIWVLASYINHSCIGNCHRSFIGDMQIVRATQDLSAGTELLFPYKTPDPLSSYEETQSGLESWGFVCDCAICVDKKTTSPEAISRRNNLKPELRRRMLLAMDSQPVHIKDAMAVLKKLEATHTTVIRGQSEQEVARQTFTPRLALADPYLALSSIFLQANKRNESIAMTVKGLEALGFDIIAPPVENKERAKLVVRSWGMVFDFVVKAFYNLVTAYRGRRPKLAAAAMKYLAASYAILVGETETLFDTFPDLK